MPDHAEQDLHLDGTSPILQRLAFAEREADFWKMQADYWRAEREKIADQLGDVEEEREHARDLAARMCAEHGRPPAPRVFGCWIDEGDQ